VLAESYRHLRTSLLLSQASAQPKVILFTSAVPNEGKTTVAVNTATVLTHSGSRVLVIDADMRRPRCHRVLSMHNRAGLTEALTSSRGAELVQRTPVENLFLMTCGRKAPNPSELLGSKRLSELLEELSGQFDHVIIDSSPVMLVSDPLVLSRAVDGVVLVVAGGQTPRQQVSAAVGRLEYVNAKIFGLVLNKVTLHKVDFPQYYSTGYQNYYFGADEDDAFDDPADNVAADEDAAKPAADRT
jgi:polysaccharide biosynthesis transport protein